MKVGDKLLFVYSDRRRGNNIEVTVEKIGRKWITVSPNYIPRLDVETLWADGGKYSSSGKAFPSQKHYQDEVELQRVWDMFRTQVSRLYQVPDGLTRKDIETAISLIFS